MLEWPLPDMELGGHMGLGTYRLLLAYLVVCSHLEINVGSQLIGVHWGVAAVVSFYLLSGYVMTALVERHYPTLQAAPSFYWDRALRILPQLWFYLIVAFAAVAFNLAPSAAYISGCTAGKVAANFFVFPFQFNWVNEFW